LKATITEHFYLVQARGAPLMVTYFQWLGKRS
jgi:hypothetical protein